MTTWADETGYDENVQRDADNVSSSSDDEVWESIKPTVLHEADEKGNRIEILKKIRRFTLERAATPADLRKKLEPFGKSKTQDKDAIVSKEPQLALELGSADRFERESRTEIKRFMAENVDDSRGAAKEEAAKDSDATAGTWGSSRATTTTKTAPVADYKRRVRVCNVSDDITEENLHNIFSANGAEVERVFLATDKTTGNNKGYAFVTFRDEKYVTLAVRQRRFNFKNVVLTVSNAMDRKV